MDTIPNVPDHDITPDVAASAFTLDAWHAVVEEEQDCATCADPMEAGQQALLVYAPEFDLEVARAVTYIHLRCYQGEDIRRETTVTGPNHALLVGNLLGGLMTLEHVDYAVQPQVDAEGNYESRFIVDAESASYVVTVTPIERES